MDIWKFKVPNGLPAHLCACALLGRVAKTIGAIPQDQNEAQSPSHLPDLKYTGTHTHATLMIFSVTWPL